MRRKPSGNWEIEIRSTRLAGGRLQISARTRDAKVAHRREVAIRRAMEAGAVDLVERLRAKAGSIHIADLTAAVEAGNLSRLRAVRSDTNGHGPLTLGSQIDRLLQTVEATKSAGTLRQYQIVAALIRERWPDDTEIAQIGSDALQDWLHEPKKTTGGRPWSPARQRLSAAILGRLFNTTIRREEEVSDRTGQTARIRRNPVRNVELPEAPMGRVEFLRPEEWRTLARKAEDLPVLALLACGCLAGLRIMEAAHLRMDIDVAGLNGDEPVIYVQPREGEYAWRPKTRRSVRTVPVEPELARILRRHVELGYAGQRYLIRAAGRDEPMSGQGLRQWVRPMFEAAGIRYGRKKDALTFHSLRHTFISWLVQADVSLKKIEIVSGTSVRMILKVYGHLIDEDLRRAVAVVDRRARGEA